MLMRGARDCEQLARENQLVRAATPTGAESWLH